MQTFSFHTIFFPIENIVKKKNRGVGKNAYITKDPRKERHKARSQDIPGRESPLDLGKV